MPFITQQQRADINSGQEPRDMGELSYLVYTIALEYVHRNGTPQWRDYAEVVGAIDSAITALKEYHMIPHEDEAILRNGDIAPPKR